MTLHLRVAGTGEDVSFAPTRLVVAGYTARDQAAVAAHIAELAEIGVAPPATVPAFYDLDPALLTTDDVVRVQGTHTSGEVEPVLVRAAGRWFLAVGSDHTDRDLERDDVAASKAACPKPIGGAVVRLPDEPASFDLDHIAAVSTVDGVPYQASSLSELLRPDEVLARMRAALPDNPLDAGEDFALFGGTTPLLDGVFVPGDRWALALRLPDGTDLTHTYETKIDTTGEDPR
jgi:4-hydroxyphenylacetate 3-monooxygenase